MLLFVLLNSWFGFAVAVWGAGMTAVFLIHITSFAAKTAHQTQRWGEVASVVLAAAVASAAGSGRGVLFAHDFVWGRDGVVGG